MACFRYVLAESSVKSYSVLTEDNSLDGEVLNLLPVVPAPPVNVFGQSVGEKLGHYPPDALFGPHLSSQAQG